MLVWSLDLLGEGHPGCCDPSRQNQPSRPSGFSASLGCQIRATCYLMGTVKLRSTKLPSDTELHIKERQGIDVALPQEQKVSQVR